MHHVLEHVLITNCDARNVICAVGGDSILYEVALSHIRCIIGRDIVYPQVHLHIDLGALDRFQLRKT